MYVLRFAARAWIPFFKKTMDFLAVQKSLVKLVKALGFSEAQGLDVWGLALDGAAPIGIGNLCFCSFCIGLPRATRIAGRDECDLYRGNNDVTVFENVFFALWSKFTSKEWKNKRGKSHFFWEKNPSCPALTTACGPSLSLSLSLSLSFNEQVQSLKRATIAKYKILQIVSFLRPDSGPTGSLWGLEFGVKP